MYDQVRNLYITKYSANHVMSLRKLPRVSCVFCSRYEKHGRRCDKAFVVARLPARERQVVPARRPTCTAAIPALWNARGLQALPENFCSNACAWRRRWLLNPLALSLPALDLRCVLGRKIFASTGSQIGKVVVLASLVMAAALLFIGCFVGSFTYILAKGVTEPVNQLVDVLRTLNRMDFSQQVPHDLI